MQYYVFTRNCPLIPARTPRSFLPSATQFSEAAALTLSLLKCSRDGRGDGASPASTSTNISPLRCPQIISFKIRPQTDVFNEYFRASHSDESTRSPSAGTISLCNTNSSIDSTIEIFLQPRTWSICASSIGRSHGSALVSGAATQAARHCWG